MPTYEYQCNSCAHTFEQFQSIKDAPLEKCPTCGESVRRLIGRGAGIIFKGSGFYQTDYRSPSYQKQAEAEKKSPVTTKKSTDSCGSSSTCKAAENSSDSGKKSNTS